MTVEGLRWQGAWGSEQVEELRRRRERRCWSGLAWRRDRGERDEGAC
jgi:hypothetical protein